MKRLGADARRRLLAGPTWTFLLFACSSDVACLSDERGAALGGAFERAAPSLTHRERTVFLGSFAQAECAHGVDAYLLIALAERESSFDPEARGPAGGMGLLQVRPPTGEATAERLGVGWKGPQSLHDPATNVSLGAAYLAKLHADFGSWEAALAAYNLGPTRLRKLVRTGKPPTSRYARAILARAAELALHRARP